LKAPRKRPWCMWNDWIDKPVDTAPRLVFLVSLALLLFFAEEMSMCPIVPTGHPMRDGSQPREPLPFLASPTSDKTRTDNQRKKHEQASVTTFFSFLSGSFTIPSPYRPAYMIFYSDDTTSRPPTMTTQN
jgi:hypothetical protein